MTDTDAVPGGSADRKAVRRALRDGRAADPRIHELTRNAAEGNLRLGWLSWLYLVIGVLQLPLLIGHVADRDWWRAALGALSLAVFTGTAFWWRTMISRSRRYGQAQPPR